MDEHTVRPEFEHNHLRAEIGEGAGRGFPILMSEQLLRFVSARHEDIALSDQVSQHLFVAADVILLHVERHETSGAVFQAVDEVDLRFERHGEDQKNLGLEEGLRNIGDRRREDVERIITVEQRPDATAVGIVGNTIVQ